MLKKAYELLISLGTFFQPFLLLAIRLFWGWQFMQGGLTKLSDISPVINYFQSLGIPIPTVSAYMAATTELVGGFCLLIGLASRLAAIPLIVVMTTAMFTAYPDVVMKFMDDPIAVTQLTPFNFWLASLIVLAFGPGAFSLDAFFKRFIFKKI